MNLSFYTAVMAWLFINPSIGWAQYESNSRPNPISPKIEAPPPQPIKAVVEEKVAPPVTDWYAPWPNGGGYSHYIGFEGSSYGTSPIGKDTVLYGKWNGDDGYQIFVGFTKTRDTMTTTNSSSTNSFANTSTSTTSYSGIKNPLTLIIGGAYLHKIHQSKWLQIAIGPFGGFSWSSDVSYPTGTTSTSLNTITGAATISQSAFGVIRSHTDPSAFLGLKIASEFYVKWFPGLALGFGTGFATQFGGKTTSNSDTVNETESVSGGVTTVTSKTSSSSSSNTDPGMSLSTFAVGGVVFQLTGTFTIHYVW
jgi:hypothetical protein